jgi:hypothetical protein
MKTRVRDVTFAFKTWSTFPRTEQHSAPALRASPHTPTYPHTPRAMDGAGDAALDALVRDLSTKVNGLTLAHFRA